MKYLFAAALVLCFSTRAFSQQNFELPDNITLKEKEDYAKYEPVVIAASHWLEDTDMDQQQSKRRKVNEFMMQWIEGSPSVNIEINETLARLYSRNQQLLVIYMAAYARHVLENKNTFSKSSASKAGLQAMIKVYKKGIGVNSSREMDRLMNMTSSELDDYVSDFFSNTIRA